MLLAAREPVTSIFCTALAQPVVMDLSDSSTLGSCAVHVLTGGPVPSVARAGRHKQRYADSGERLVAGCIPVRCKGDNMHDVEVLLISSRNGNGYCLPKGGWEEDETLPVAARRETLEEAGVRGELEEPCLGVFAFQSGKGAQVASTRHQGRCRAYMYVLHVAEMLNVWPEANERSRLWVPLVEAVHRCRHEWMREALLTWIHHKNWSLPAADTMNMPSTHAPDTSHVTNAGAALHHQAAVSAVAAPVASCASSSSTVVVAGVGAHGQTCATSVKHVKVATAHDGDQQTESPPVGGGGGQCSPSFTRDSVTFASANSLSTELSETAECVETAAALAARS